MPSVREDERRVFVATLVEAAWDPDRRMVVVVALRADSSVASRRTSSSLISSGRTTCCSGRSPRPNCAARSKDPPKAQALGRAGARRRARRRRPGESGALPLLSTALLDLWRDRDGPTLTLAAYARIGGISGAVGRHAEAAFASLDRDERSGARRLLLRLVDGRRREALDAASCDSGRARGRRSASRARARGLVERRLLVVDGGSVELVHEALLDQWPTLADWLEEDAQGRRLRRRVAQAAAEWDAAGRDASELYRGARLAAAAEWADAAGPESGLNRVERAFLDASRTAFAREEAASVASTAAARVARRSVALLAAAAAAGAVALVDARHGT